MKQEAVLKGVFLKQKEYGINWPGACYDINTHIKEYSEKLSKMAEELNVRIDLENPLCDENDVIKLSDSLKKRPLDGIIIIALCLETWELARRIVELGVPSVIFTPYFCFTKHIKELSYKKGVWLISSLDFDTVRYGIEMIKTIQQLRSSRIVVLQGEETTPKDTVIAKLGTKVRTIGSQKFVDEFNSVRETEEVLAIASEYIKNAKKVVEPTRKEIINATKTYIALKRILKEFEGDAISIDCLGLLRQQLIPVTPCIGLSRLNDEGIPAGCEADIDSILTMIILRHLFNKPGFIGDPTVDTVKNTWINSHCTSATKLAGIGESSEPFLLRRFGHLPLGVSPQVLWREGQEVTLVKFQGPDEMVIGSGKVIGNIDTPPADICVTSVEIKVDGVKDVRETEREIKALHVLLIYGNHVKDLKAFCQLIGIRTSLI